MVEQMEMRKENVEVGKRSAEYNRRKREELEIKQPATPSKYAGLGAAITAELMIGFWFGVGVMLPIGVAMV